MVTVDETEELVIALRRTGAIAGADLYLIGSRARGLAGPASDWDLVALVESDPERESLLPLPTPPLPSGATDVLGPRGRTYRERLDLTVWTWELDAACLLARGWGGGETYRAAVRLRWEAERDLLAARWWARFRLHRGAAAALVSRQDHDSAMLSLALAARAGARAWLLGTGRPYPPDKWLPRLVEEEEVGPIVHKLLHEGGAGDTFEALRELSALIETAVGAQALGDWWELLDPAC